MFIYNILIFIFGFLLAYQLYLEFSKSYIIEGMDSNTTSYTSYDNQDSTTNALILAQQNAGNIVFLKQQIDDLLPLKTQLADLTNEVNTMSSQLNDLAQQIAEYATTLAGTDTPAITGTDYTSTTST